jgi:hypothetical protein
MYTDTGDGGIHLFAPEFLPGSHGVVPPEMESPMSINPDCGKDSEYSSGCGTKGFSGKNKSTDTKKTTCSLFLIHSLCPVS